MTKKPNYSSFFLRVLPWFKKCIFWKNSLSPFWDPWGQEAIFEDAEAKFWISSIFNGFSFRIFIILCFEDVWPQQPQRPRRPQKGLREFFQKLHFWNQDIPTKKMRYVTASWSKFSLNLSTEEVWSAKVWFKYITHFGPNMYLFLTFTFFLHVLNHI